MRTRSLLVALGLVLVLAACDNAEERAEGHYQSGLELLASGDRDRARVEFLSVFKYNGRHRAARLALADLFRDQGDLREAYAQFLRVAEQYPDDTTARIALARISISVRDWVSAEPHIEKLLVVAGEAPETLALKAVDDYHTAILDEDATARRDAATRAEALIPRVPDEVLIRAIAAESYGLDGEYAKGLALIAAALEVFPKDLTLYRLQLGMQDAVGDTDAYEASLKQMVEQFPDNDQISAALVAFYGERGDVDRTEAFLRARITPSEPDDKARRSLINFLNSIRGPEQALNAVEEFIVEGTNPQVFRAIRAELLFGQGRANEAIAELQDVLRSAEDTIATREIQVMLAQILSRSGNEVGARSLVEEVLEKDPGMVQALRMKALWLIAADDADQAIVLLRRALDQEPSNPQILSAMAQAYVLNGERVLAGEMLTLAVQASNRAAAESLTYAGFLMQDARYAAAENVLLDALRLRPDSLALLQELAKVYVALEDWPRAEQTERTLRALDTDAGRDMADRLRVAILRGQDRNDDVISFLENLPNSGLEGDVTIVRAYLSKNDPTAALAHLEGLIRKAPQDPALRFLQAAIFAATGDLAGAEQAYRALIDEGFGGERTYLELVRVLSATGRTEEAQQVLQSGLDQFPQAVDLKWVRASQLERARDFEGAIRLYEELYAQNTSTSVIANNLASLLSTERSDPDSLDTAYKVARRLRDTDFPPYQDTYGWIAFLRGDHAEAVRYLEPAAKGLAGDPQVRFHLGMAYDAVGRPQDAITQFRAAIELAEDDPRPFLQTAREKLAALEAQRDNPAPKTSE